MTDIAIADRSAGAGALSQLQVGKQYHLGIGARTGAAGGALNMYGFMLVPKGSGGNGFNERTDVTTNDKLIQIASPNATDRDLVKTPRVTDGDFSGGGLQQIFINPKKFWDSDMEVRVPGSLQLRAAWKRTQQQANVDPQVNPIYYQGQAVAFNGDMYVTYGESAQNIYRASGVLHPPYSTYVMCTDGQFLYGADRSGNVWQYDGTSFITLANGLQTNIDQIWAIYLGTGGRYLYYTYGQFLVRMDLSSTPPLSTQLPVPMGPNPTTIVDITPYAGGIAILTNEYRGSTMTVHFHDGFNLQLILRMRGFTGKGLTDCLGELYVTAESYGNLEPPVLLRVSSGSFSIAARLGSLLPNPAKGNLRIGAPAASGQYVAFTVVNPVIQNATGGAGYVGVYDVLADSYSHLGALDANDAMGTGVRSLAYLGRALFMPSRSGGGAGNLQYQVSQLKYLADATTTFAATGIMVSSLFDFGTPGVSKQFRRVQVHHAPLQPGESIKVQAFVNQDPGNYTAALQDQGNVTHAYAAGDAQPSSTVLNIPGKAQGFSMFFVLTVTSGTKTVGGAVQQTTPTIYWSSVEISPGWTIELTVACVNKQLTIDGREDPQQLMGQDRYGLLHNAWENALPLTVWHPNGLAYTYLIQECSFDVISPINDHAPLRPSDTERHCHLILTETTI